MRFHALHETEHYALVYDIFTFLQKWGNHPVHGNPGIQTAWCKAVYPLPFDNDT